MTPSLSGIGQIAIAVRDVEQATAWYRDVLGLPLLFAQPPSMSFLAAGSVRIMLSTPQGYGTPGANSALYFTVTDIERTHAALLARGASDERGPALAASLPDHDLWLGFLRDPEGNLIGLMEERLRP